MFNPFAIRFKNMNIKYGTYPHDQFYNIIDINLEMFQEFNLGEFYRTMASININSEYIKIYRSKIYLHFVNDEKCAKDLIQFVINTIENNYSKKILCESNEFLDYYKSLFNMLKKIDEMVNHLHIELKERY